MSGDERRGNRTSQLPLQRQRPHVTAIAKKPTRIVGLDEILHGGLPCGQATLISGGPGSGKTLFGLEVLYRAAVNDEPGVFVSFEESAEAVRRNALSLGWDFAELEDAGKLLILDGRIDPSVVRAGDFDIHGFLAILSGQAEAMGARCVVIDAIDGLLRLFTDPQQGREQLELLHRWLIEHELTAVLTAKSADDDLVRTNYDFLEYMVDCVIKLDQRVSGQISTRRLRVVKYRGSAYERNEHPFAITATGIRLVPVSGVELLHHASDEVFSIGNDDIDRLLGGGLIRASSTLISGASGTGKTSLAASAALAACERGERVLYVQFEESGPTMVMRMLSPGIDLRPAIETDLLRINAAIPESMGVEEHLIRILAAAEDHSPSIIIVDAITAASRMSSPEAAYDFLVRLVSTSRKQGISTILTHQSREITERGVLGAMGLSSLLDTVIMLSYEEEADTFYRSVLVLKSRGMNHSHRRERFEITEEGIRITDRDGGKPEGAEGGHS